MVVEQKGFFFRNVEKIICGAVALVFIGALVHVVLLNVANDLDRTLAGMADHMEIIREEAEEADDIEVEIDEEAYREKWERWITAQEMRLEPGDIFWPPIPQDYPELVVGTGGEHYLSFEDPLDKGSVSVSVVEGDDVLSEDEDGEVFRHPVHGDFSRVLIYAGPGEGTVRITGTGGGRPHIRELTTDASIRRRPDPPRALAFDGDFGRGRSTVELYFESNPENRGDVIVKEYRIYRKRARDLLAECEEIDTVMVDAAELTEEARDKLEEEDILLQGEDGHSGDLPGDGGFRYIWHDDVGPDEIFLYKVRTIGLRSRPEESEYSEMLRVKTPPVVDFFFDRRVGRDDGLRFGVALETDGEFDRTDIDHFVGDMIGRPVYYDRGLSFFDTESILLDFHRDALRRRPTYAMGRIIYIDKWGDIAARWRGHWGTGEDGRSDPW